MGKVHNLYNWGMGPVKCITEECTVLKTRTFSVVNAWVLHGHCDRLRIFLHFFVWLIADTFRHKLRTILVFLHRKMKSCTDQVQYLPDRTPPLYQLNHLNYTTIGIKHWGAKSRLSSVNEEIYDETVFKSVTLNHLWLAVFITYFWLFVG